MNRLARATTTPDCTAWSELLPGRIEHDRLQRLTKRKKSAVYRIAGAGRGGTAVIAKLCPPETGAIERTVYERILAHLPLSTPHYYGAVQTPDGSLWILLEDVAAEQFSPLDAEHRLLAARWLGALHSRARVLRFDVELPERGPDHYRACLERARELIVSSLGYPPFGADDVALLEAVLRQCDMLESSWRFIEALCASVPVTLTHGDFRPKNTYVRRDAAGLQLLPLDWETAGWGFAGIDIAPARPLPVDSLVDMAAYTEIVRQEVPDLDVAAIARHARLGVIFRRVAAIQWAAVSLAGEWWRKRLEYLRIYHADLEGLLRNPPWA